MRIGTEDTFLHLHEMILRSVSVIQEIKITPLNMGVDEEDIVCISRMIVLYKELLTEEKQKLVYVLIR